MKKQFLWVALFLGSVSMTSPALAIPAGGGGGGTSCHSCKCTLLWFANDISCLCSGKGSGAGCNISIDARRCTTLAGPCLPAIGGFGF